MKRFSILIVLTGQTQVGGGFHQSVTNLVRVLAAIPDGARASILDLNGSFSPELQRFMSSGLVVPSQIVQLPKKAPSDRGHSTGWHGFFRRFIQDALLRKSERPRSTLFADFVDNSSYEFVIFLGPSARAIELKKKPFAWCFWDIAHIDHPEFPEVGSAGQFERREATHATALRKATLIVADSHRLVSDASKAFGVKPEKFVVIPLEPPAFTTLAADEPSALPEELADISGRYFFYPAQLWRHKNHLRIVEAVATLNAEGHDFHVVFVGKDYGAGSTLSASIDRLGMSDKVHLLGWVEDSLIPELYRNAIALVMASYFGPTNIPPLEAMALGTPVVAADQHREQLGNAALYFDPDDATALSEQMLETLSPAVRRKLIDAGQQQLREITELRRLGVLDLSERLGRLGRRLIS